MRIRIINRVVILYVPDSLILLVRNQGANFWYPPGGGWETEQEDIRSGAVREVLEEVGIPVEVSRLLYVRTFDPDSETRHLELIWLAHALTTELPKNHHDAHGIVEEARWFSQTGLQGVKVFPKELASSLWTDMSAKERDPFIP